MPFNAESTEGLATTFVELIEAIHRIDANTRPGGLRREDICRRYLRCSMSHARKLGPWIWPNFGESDVPGKQVWFFETCEAWYAVPMHVHEAQYHREMLKRRPA